MCIITYGLCLGEATRWGQGVERRSRWGAGLKTDWVKDSNSRKFHRAKKTGGMDGRRLILVDKPTCGPMRRGGARQGRGIIVCHSYCTGYLPGRGGNGVREP